MSHSMLKEILYSTSLYASFVGYHNDRRFRIGSYRSCSCASWCSFKCCQGGEERSWTSQSSSYYTSIILEYLLTPLLYELFINSLVSFLHTAFLILFIVNGKHTLAPLTASLFFSFFLLKSKENLGFVTFHDFDITWSEQRFGILRIK